MAGLDLFAEPHLAAWRRGVLDDDTLRRILAELIAESDVPSVVARRVRRSGRGYDARLHADLTEKLRTLLVDKMLAAVDDFRPAPAGSIRGWAWNLASTAAVYQRRDLRRFYARFQLLAHDTDLTVVGGSPEASPPPPRTDSLGCRHLRRRRRRGPDPRQTGPGTGPPAGRGAAHRAGSAVAAPDP